MSPAEAPLLLAIDVGNTNTVFGVYRLDARGAAEGAPIDHGRVTTPSQATTDEFGVVLLSVLAARGIDKARVAEAVVACVVPPAEHAVRRACRRYFDVEARFVGRDVTTGIAVDVDHPAEVGADRLVNALAAHELCGGPCIVVDFGTATTFDVVGGTGVYRGGAIAPGIGISLEALEERASKLPKVEIRRPPVALGRSTVASMQSGIVFGYVGLVDGLVARLRSEMPEEEVEVIATGGLASLIARETRTLERVEPLLTLEGLKLVQRRLCTAALRA